MIRARVVVLAVVLLVLIVIVGRRVVALQRELANGNVTIALAFNPDELNEGAASSREAYTQVMREEGLSTIWVSTHDLLLARDDALRTRYRAIIFPDGLNQHLSAELTDRMASYVKTGGTLAVIYDAGSRDKGRHFLDDSTFASLVGVNYGGYTRMNPHVPLPPGGVAFSSSSQARLWSIPPGKLDGNKLVGYHYGTLLYPMGRADLISHGGAQMQARYGDVAVISVRHFARGNAIWVNLPLGYLKAHGDDLPLRSIMRTIARRFARVPYIMPVPHGVGTVMIDWHIDSEIERRGIPNLMRYGILRHSVPMEFDVTAGPDLNAPGDGLGIDACGRGRGLVKLLARYGAIGSHGGWAHNWFARRLAAGEFTAADIKDLVARNDRCLESVTGKAVVSYAAPVGVHPQPLMTRVLSELGFSAYYYTGDTGSAPNLTFVDGKMISSSLRAFPIMPYHQFASVAEMRRGGVSAATMRGWLLSTIAYLGEEHTASLIYSHPYDLLYGAYALQYGRFMDEVQREIGAHELQAMTMPDFAIFSKRLEQTTLIVEPWTGRWRAILANPQGLGEIAIALPDWLQVQTGKGPSGMHVLRTEPGYRLYEVTGNSTHIEIPLAEVKDQGATN